MNLALRRRPLWLPNIFSLRLPANPDDGRGRGKGMKGQRNRWQRNGDGKKGIEFPCPTFPCPLSVGASSRGTPARSAPWRNDCPRFTRHISPPAAILPFARRLHVAHQGGEFGLLVQGSGSEGDGCFHRRMTRAAPTARLALGRSDDRVSIGSTFYFYSDRKHRLTTGRGLDKFYACRKHSEFIWASE